MKRRSLPHTSQILIECLFLNYRLFRLVQSEPYKTFSLSIFLFQLSHLFFFSFQQTGIYRLFPFLSKFFLRAISVGKIEPIKGTSCIPIIIPPTVPTVSTFFPITKSINITVIGNALNPQIYHILPQYLWANSHVSLFFIDMEVLYPNTPLIVFGTFFIKCLPKPIIVNGRSKSIINI